VLTLTFHPLCVKLIPPQTDKEAEELLADIRKNKLQVPVMLHKGQILDGRGRYDACLKLAKEGVETGFKTVLYRGTDEEARDYVISINLKRRHMTTSQRAMWAARMVTTTHGGDRKNQSGNFPLEMTQAEAAECFNVSTSLVTDAVKILPDAELVADVQKGDKSVSAALKAFNKKAEEAKRKAEGGAANDNQQEGVSPPQSGSAPSAPTPDPLAEAKAMAEALAEDLVGAVAILKPDDAKAVIDRLFQQLRLIVNSKGITLATD
jgi:hypothetical protein